MADLTSHHECMGMLGMQLIPSRHHVLTSAILPDPTLNDNFVMVRMLLSRRYLVKFDLEIGSNECKQRRLHHLIDSEIISVILVEFYSRQSRVNFLLLKTQ